MMQYYKCTSLKFITSKNTHLPNGGIYMKFLAEIHALTLLKDLGCWYKNLLSYYAYPSFTALWGQLLVGMIRMSRKICSFAAPQPTGPRVGADSRSTIS